MDKPKCRLCGKSHWLVEGCSYEPEEFRKGGFDVSEGASAPRRSDELGSAKDSESEGGDRNESLEPDVRQRETPAERSRRWRKENRERYNAQKREQMRRLRRDKPTIQASAEEAHEEG